MEFSRQKYWGGLPFYPHITIICEDSSFLFLVQILGNKCGSWWRGLTITRRFWTLSGWRDHTGPWVASRGWMEVSECGFYLEKRVEWLFGDQKDWLWYKLLFANSFPFLPRHPSASFPSFPCRQAEPHDFLLANGMRPKWYNPLPSSVHKDQLSSLCWIFLCLPALCQCYRWPWWPCVVRGRIYHPELLNNCVKLSSQAPQTGLCVKLEMNFYCVSAH